MKHQVLRSFRRRSEIPNSRKEVTHYTGPILSKMRSAEYLYDSLSVGSKNRLRQYQYQISVSRGSNDERYFDKPISEVLLRYALDPAAMESEMGYLSRVSDEDGHLFSRNLRRYDSTEEAMERFADRDYSSFRWNRNYRKSLEQLRIKFSDAHLKPLSFTCDDDVIDNLPKKDTHSGYYYIESGKKDKGDNMEGIYRKVQEEFPRAIINGSFNRPIMISFRTQASGEYTDEGQRTGTCKHKTRVVSMVDLLVIIAELKFSRPLQRWISKDDRYAGGKESDVISSIISNYRSRNKRYASLDYSSYDQTISSWLIEDAFSLIKEAFIPMSEQDEAIFDVVVHDFIHKDFILNEGVLHSDKGVPSGSMFTQLIDTIVNWMMVYTYFNSINENCDMIAMGDDNLVYSRCYFDISDISTYISKNFGVKVNADKSSFGSHRDSPEFLKKVWRVDGRWRHPYLLESRLLYPEHWRVYSRKTNVSPELVVYAYILEYKLGMMELIDVNRFLREHPFSQRDLVGIRGDSRYVPGIVAYQNTYLAA